ncbi:MAG TPA: hypothetical protein VMV07_04350 [Streptosporangiaceae bacterium]|nr:hypothetical protein [Streptosporangiaceae bacterium]
MFTADGRPSDDDRVRTDQRWATSRAGAEPARRAAGGQVAGYSHVIIDGTLIPDRDRPK